MIITNFKVNEPLTTTGCLKGISAIPERLRSTSAPSSFPIVGDDLNSKTKIKEEEHKASEKIKSE